MDLLRTIPGLMRSPRKSCSWAETCSGLDGPVMGASSGSLEASSLRMEAKIADHRESEMAWSAKMATVVSTAGDWATRESGRKANAATIKARISARRIAADEFVRIGMKTR